MIMPLFGLTHHISTDPDSWMTRNWAIETEIPVSPTHPGSYLYKRKHHIHEGIDLYCNPGQPVVAMATGIVTNIIPFTGEIAGTPHWNNTYGVVIQDTKGVWIYGEIQPAQGIEIGQILMANVIVGHVIPVLKKDKGRPTSMLHLERYTKGTTTSVGIILHSDEIPDNIRNPITSILD